MDRLIKRLTLEGFFGTNRRTKGWQECSRGSSVVRRFAGSGTGKAQGGRARLRRWDRPDECQAIFGSNQDVGKGISNLLINELVNDGRFRVIERSAIDKILKEQNFSNSDRVNSATAAKIGSLLGVDTIIIGDVTQFGRDDKHYGAGGGGGNIWNAAAPAPSA